MKKPRNKCMTCGRNGVNRMSDLKPCPFCGSKKISLRGGKNIAEVGSFWYIVCESCFVASCGDEDKEKAISQWNVRVGDRE